MPSLLAGKNMKVKKNNQTICFVFITINNSSLLVGEHMTVKKSISPNCLIFITINNFDLLIIIVPITINVYHPGNPAPNFIWKKNGKKLRYTDSRLEISSSSLSASSTLSSPYHHPHFITNHDKHLSVDDYTKRS